MATEIAEEAEQIRLEEDMGAADVFTIGMTINTHAFSLRDCTV